MLLPNVQYLGLERDRRRDEGRGQISERECNTKWYVAIWLVGQ